MMTLDVDATSKKVSKFFPLLNKTAYNKTDEKKSDSYNS